MPGRLRFITKREAQLFKTHDPVLHTVATHENQRCCLVCYQILQGAYVVLIKSWYSCACDTSIGFSSDWAYHIMRAEESHVCGFILLSDVPYAVIRKVFYRLAARASYPHSCLEWEKEHNRWIHLGKQYGNDV